MVTAKKTPPVATDTPAKTKASAKKTDAVPAAVAAPKAAPKKAPAKKAAVSKVEATQAALRPAVSHEQRHNYIEVAAFYVAQRRGFAPGNPLDDWATAEIEVDRLIASGHFSK